MVTSIHYKSDCKTPKVILLCYKLVTRFRVYWFIQSKIIQENKKRATSNIYLKTLKISGALNSGLIWVLNSTL